MVWSAYRIHDDISQRSLSWTSNYVASKNIADVS